MIFRVALGTGLTLGLGSACRHPEVALLGRRLRWQMLEPNEGLENIEEVPEDVGETWPE